LSTTQVTTSAYMMTSFLSPKPNFHSNKT